MKIGWLSGWAVPEAWFEAQAREALPRAEHRFATANPNALRQLQAEGPFDWIVGYSLGALLLLTHPRAAEELGRVALLAPIFSFPQEEGRGGKILRTQIRHLPRLLARDPIAPVRDFYRRAGLDGPDPVMGGLDLASLRWGLERLEKDSADPPMPEGWIGWCGGDDALLDAAKLVELDPSISIVPGATHHPGPLMRAFAERVGR